MRLMMAMAAGATMLLASCGRPAAEQPEPQRADLAAPAADAVAAGDGFPAMPSLEEVAAAAAAVGMEPTPETRALLTCDNGEKLAVRFFPEQGIAVLLRGGQSFELNQEPAASGIRYSGYDIVLAGKGDDVLIEMGDLPDLRCTAA